MEMSGNHRKRTEFIRKSVNLRKGPEFYKSSTPILPTSTRLDLSRPSTSVDPVGLDHRPDRQNTFQI